MERIRKIVEKSGADAFVITKTEEKTTEVFLVKDKIDLTRGTFVSETEVKLYRDFEEDGQKYRGSALFEVGAMDSDAEIKRKADKAYLAARYVKNPWYPLKTPEKLPEAVQVEPVRQLFMEKFDDVFKALYPAFEGAGINSCELFAREGIKHLVSSAGMDVTWPISRLDFELVTEADGCDEGVEIFNEYALGTLDIEKISDIVLKQLENTKNRSEARKAHALQDVKVVMSGDDVERIFKFYISQASDNMVYQKMSRAKKGERFLEKDLDITIQPLDFTADKAPVDSEGTVCEAFEMYDKGVLKKLSAGCQYGFYLGEPVTGCMATYKVNPGKKSKEELLAGDYLELLTFSDFQMDPATGDFGGEFRLARYVHDGQTDYLSGGAISGNIFDVQEKMEWSREMKERPHSLTPEVVVFPDMKVTGEA